MHRNTSLASLAVIGGLAISPFIGVSGALAANGDTTANLEPVALNGVQASGSAMVQVNGNRIDVSMAASGLLADMPHAAHIHFGAGARQECPAAGDDANGNGIINTAEGEPAYGPIVVSLTKTGDTSPDSALAVERFDTAPGGELTYERGSITVSPEVASAVASGGAAVVVHGVDHNGSGKYDGKRKSELDPKLPAEATDPAVCGVLFAAPAGGADTGFGGTAVETESGIGTGAGLLAVGGGLLVAAAGTTAVAARKARTQS